MTHISHFTAVDQQQLTLDELLATTEQEEAEAIQETDPMGVCSRCIYARRPCCRDETPAERLFCPVVGAILSGDGDGITCLTSLLEATQACRR